MALTDADRVTLTARLAEAESALHTLLIGGAKTRVRYGDQEFSKQPGSIAQLRAYIVELKGQLAAVGCQPARMRGRRVSWG